MECTLQKSGNRVKEEALEVAVLGYPNKRDTITLTLYAPSTGLVVIRTQRQRTEDRIIAYDSIILFKN